MIFSLTLCQSVSAAFHIRCLFTFFFKPENFRIGDHQSILFKEHLSLIRTVKLELDSSDVHVPGRKETVPKAQTQEETRESHLDKHPQNYTETKGLVCQHTSRKAQVRTHECEDNFKIVILKNRHMPTVLLFAQNVKLMFLLTLHSLFNTQRPYMSLPSRGFWKIGKIMSICK